MIWQKTFVKILQKMISLLKISIFMQNKDLDTI